MIIGFSKSDKNISYQMKFNHKNDTTIGRKDIKIYYKQNDNLVDSVHILDKKYVLKERGYIKNNTIKFFNLKNDLSSVGKFYNGDLQGIFLFFKDDKLYKTVEYKNGKEDGMSIVFTKDLKIEVISSSSNDSIAGFSLVFDKDYPKYIRTKSFSDSLTVMGTFSTNGILESLSLPNISDDYFERAIVDPSWRKQK